MHRDMTLLLGILMMRMLMHFLAVAVIALLVMKLPWVLF